ncbi:MAG: hypothetical protein ACI94Y_001273 [Maribacter sp.]
MILREKFNNQQKKDFKEFENLVNDQVFSLLDSIVEKIESHNFKIRERNWKIYDIQIFVEQNISFRITFDTLLHTKCTDS